MTQSAADLPTSANARGRDLGQCTPAYLSPIALQTSSTVVWRPRLPNKYRMDALRVRVNNERGRTAFSSPMARDVLEYEPIPGITCFNLGGCNSDIAGSLAPRWSRGGIITCVGRAKEILDRWALVTAGGQAKGATMYVRHMLLMTFSRTRD